MRALGFMLLLLAWGPASAYVGPGSGLSLLSSLWTVLLGFALTLFAILWWPVRLIWKRIRRRRNRSAVIGAATDDPKA